MKSILSKYSTDELMNELESRSLKSSDMPSTTQGKKYTIYDIEEIYYESDESQGAFYEGDVINSFSIDFIIDGEPVKLPYVCNSESEFDEMAESQINANSEYDVIDEEDYETITDSNGNRILCNAYDILDFDNEMITRILYTVED